jgi:hypothetical protein
MDDGWWMMDDGMVWYGMVWYDMVWYGMVWTSLTEDDQCSAVQCSAVQCSAVQCSAVQCLVSPDDSAPSADTGELSASVSCQHHQHSRLLSAVQCSAVQCSAVQHDQRSRVGPLWGWQGRSMGGLGHMSPHQIHSNVTSPMQWNILMLNMRLYVAEDKIIVGHATIHQSQGWSL